MPVTSHMPRFGERNQSRIRSGVTLALLAVWALLALSACAQPGAASAIAGEVVHELQPTGITTRIPFLDQSGCSGTFVSHDLDNVSLIPGDQGVRMFDSNGSGVALGDLNGDLLPEIAFANLSEPNAILWNLGESRFTRNELSHQDSRAAAMVDVDGDGVLDLVFTRRLDPPVAYLSNVNTSGVDGQFSISWLPGVAKTAYSMAWADIDRDGDLDLLTGSYDLELKALLAEAFEGQTNSGVYWHERRESQFHSHLLALHSQALALTVVPSVDGMKLTAGNDFLLPDGAWVWREGEWHVDAPFAHTTQNTMSFSVGDVNNDGRLDLFAADMRPRVIDEDIMAAWQPVMAKVLEDPTDRQITENVLQLQNADGTFVNLAPETGVAATGWTWSTQLADFDQDGFLDLYVVNGMNALEMFSHLPGNELVETNWAFRNQQGKAFVPAPEWNLGLQAGGRGMTTGDMDFDGDLDIVISNLLAPAVLLENQLCQGSSIQVRLRDGQVQNTRGIGARLILQTDSGTQHRLLEVSSGYLSGLPPVIHFGFPEGAKLQRLEVVWPDGESHLIQDLEANHLYTVHRTR